MKKTLKQMCHWLVSKGATTLTAEELFDRAIRIKQNREAIEEIYNLHSELDK